jgi:hypothetical protein
MTTCQSWKKELLKDLNLLKVNGKIILRRNNYGHA